MLTVLDEYSRECLAIRVRRRLNSRDVVMALSRLFIHKGIPEYIRSDNGAEFTSKFVRNWLAAHILENLDQNKRHHCIIDLGTFVLVQSLKTNVFIIDLTCY